MFPKRVIALIWYAMELLTYAMECKAMVYTVKDSHSATVFMDSMYE